MKGRDIKPGDRFGSLTVQERLVGSRPNVRTICDCGNVHDTRTHSLANGSVVRCPDCSRLAIKGRPNLKNRVGPLERTINEQWNVFRKNVRDTHGLDLNKEQWLELVKQNCFYCDKPPSNKRKASVPYAQDFYYSGIDRIENKSYSVENCVPCCWPCNRAKSGMTPGEFYLWCQKISNRLGRLYEWAAAYDDVDSTAEMIEVK